MERLATDDEQRRKIKTIFRASGIHSRYSVLEDYGRQEQFSFYPNTSGMDPFPSTSNRMKVYAQEVVQLSIDAIEECRNKTHVDYASITHLITVSCTGMYAPGLDIDLVNRLGLSRSVSRTCINFMGCFAAITALKTAHAFCQADPSAKVLVVCTELCSIHFQKDFSDDTILANALFGDGAAAMIVESRPSKGALRIDGFHHELVTDGGANMAWTIGNLGFEMKLSTYVPELLRGVIDELIARLLEQVQLTQADVNFFAVHPGGKKIVDAVGDKLALRKEQLQFSYDVLRDYGNMSSPTVIFVLDKILASHQAVAGNRIVAMGFGPGITLESMILTVM